MTYALIDNATLTAVQRATGAVAVKTSDTINGDLCALENFLQGNLFSDDLLSIDNYKPEHRYSRKQHQASATFISEASVGLRI